MDASVTRGCLLAVACGDALGAGFEGGAPVPTRRIAERERGDAPLRWTDDTAMTLALAAHLARRGGTVDQDALAAEFADAWQVEPGRGYGPGPPRIFAQTLRGTDWRVASRGVYPGGSFGNGGAMRVAGVGLLPYPLQRVADLAGRSAEITHAHPLGRDGAAVQACAVALAARRRGPFDRDGFLATLTEAVPSYAERLAVVAELPADASPPYVAGVTGTDISAPASVPAALAAFTARPDDPAEAIRFAIAMGGDTDTIAAMAGAAAGARCGPERLPGRWLRRLEAADRIRRVADALADALARAAGEPPAE